MAMEEQSVFECAPGEDYIDDEFGGTRNGNREMSVARALKDLDERQIAQGLGWFSIGLGLAEIAAPETVARLIGVRNSHILLRAFGLRELVSGIGILAGRRRSEWLWSRVVGDVMDLAFLGGALGSDYADRGKVAAATFAVGGVTALDVLCSQQLRHRDSSATETGSTQLTTSIVINRPPEELYRFWRDFQNLPRFMFHIDSVGIVSEGRSHWVVKAPAGGSVEWDAEILEDRPNEMISWRTVEGSDVRHSGTVRFLPASGGRGTTVRVEIEYCPPGGVLGMQIAKLFGREPGQQVQEDLRRLKQLMEAGEIITTEGQPSGRPRSTSLKYDQTSRHSADVNYSLERGG
jgi:uncharacterized membrane protein